MHYRSACSFLAGFSVAAVLAIVPATAAWNAAPPSPDRHPNAYDGTAPSLTVAPARFVTGASIDAANAPSDDACAEPVWNYDIPLVLRWAGRDRTSGIAEYDVWALGSQFGNDEIAHDVPGHAWRYTGSNYDGSNCGGPTADGGFGIVARDNRGNSAASNYYANQWVTVWQENGKAPSEDAIDPLAVSRRGHWASSHCSCFNGGTTSFSTKSGAWTRFVVHTERPGQTVALVMEKNANRGKAAISVDGRRAGVIDTHAVTPTHRVIMWQRTLSVGTHVIQVANLGTSGRSRIDIDSLMLTRQAQPR